MMLAWVAAVVLAQGAEAEIFAETEGWSIARHGGGCLMTREFGGDGNTIVTFSVDPTDTSAPLTILVGNTDWALPDADDDGYRIEFSGSEAVWRDLAVRTFTTDDDGDGRVDGVIRIGFTSDAITPMLEDVAGATGLHLSRQGETVDRVALSGTEAAVHSLGSCVSTLP
jgi:hypothetical protein